MSTFPLTPDEQIILGRLLNRLLGLAAADERPRSAKEGKHSASDPGAIYDDRACAAFVKDMALGLIERAIVLYEALEADGRIGSVELARRLGTEPGLIGGLLTSHLKIRAGKLGLPLPFDGGRGHTEAYGGISEPGPDDDPSRTYWVDRGGLAARMLSALREERERRGAGESPPEDREEVERLRNTVDSKSEIMRRLHDAGWSRSRIARAMGVRYQFVDNVLRNAGLI